jgi:hypothetical protein
MTTQELISAIDRLLLRYDSITDTDLRVRVYVALGRMIDELKDRAIGLSDRGKDEQA